VGYIFKNPFIPTS
jgi:hypothetical protein